MNIFYLRIDIYKIKETSHLQVYALYTVSIIGGMLLTVSALSVLDL